MKHLLGKALFASTLLASSGVAMASHVPAIEITLDGRGARYVEPVLVVKDSEEALPFFLDKDTYLFEDATPGSYVLTLVDKDYGDVLLVEPLTVTAKGSHHLQGNTRHITCTFRSGAIECLNNY